MGTYFPKIKGAKKRDDKPKVKSYTSFSLVEKQVLLRKYMSQGMGFFSAKMKVKSDIDYLKPVVQKAKQKKEPESKINQRFQKALERISHY